LLLNKVEFEYFINERLTNLMSIDFGLRCGVQTDLCGYSKSNMDGSLRSLRDPTFVCVYDDINFFFKKKTLLILFNLNPLK